MPTRRIFLMTGLAGGALLATAYYARRHRGFAPTSAALPAPLGPDAVVILRAIIPAMLTGAIASAGAEHATDIRETSDGVVQAVAGLPPATQRELAELFALLAWPPTRWGLAGLAVPWTEADPVAAHAALERWRTSRFDLLRSAYDGLHQLIFAAWYGNPRSWPAIGYAGPPVLTA